MKNDLYDTSLCYLVYQMMNLWLSTNSSTMITFHARLVCHFCALVLAIFENVATRFGCDGTFNVSFLSHIPREFVSERIFLKIR